MFISVDLPAPFSPSSAWTSPSRSSKSMLSFARTPGNCLVMLKSARTTSVSAMPGDPNRAETEEGGHTARPLRTTIRQRLQGRRRLDLAGDDLRLEGVEPRLVGGRHLRAYLAPGDDAVLQVERD